MTNQAIMSRTKGGFLADRATRHVREKMCRRSSDLSMSSMSFASGSFDLVLSNTVIEHVGDSENQKRFLSECVRIAKRLHRAILNELSMNFFAREENPILLSKRDLLSLTGEARRLRIFGGGGGICLLTGYGAFPRLYLKPAALCREEVNVDAQNRRYHSLLQRSHHDRQGRP